MLRHNLACGIAITLFTASCGDVTGPPQTQAGLTSQVLHEDSTQVSVHNPRSSVPPPKYVAPTVWRSLQTGVEGMRAQESVLPTAGGVCVTGAVPERLDVITDQQYELLRQVLLKDVGVLTQRWAEKNQVNISAGQLHTGVDFGTGSRCDPANPSIDAAVVFSATVGIVVADPSDNPYGRVSVYNPVTNLTVHYTHLQRNFVVKPQTISSGDPIGLVGKTAPGPALRPHLHFSANIGRGVVSRESPDVLDTVNPYEAVFPAYYASTFGQVGSLWKVDPGTGAVVLLSAGLIFPEDISVDSYGRLHVVENDFAAVTSRITRFDPVTLTSTTVNSGNALAPVCSPEGPTLRPTRKAGDFTTDLFVNTRQGPCPHTGVWMVKSAEVGKVPTRVIPPFPSFVVAFGEGTAAMANGDVVAVVSSIAGGFTVDAAVISTAAPGSRLIDLSAVPGVGLVVPVGVAVDSHDNLYIVDPFRGTVELFDPRGSFLRTYATGLLRPHFIEIDSQDHVIVAEGGSGRVLRLGPVRALDDVLAVIPGSLVGLGRGATAARTYVGKAKD